MRALVLIGLVGAAACGDNTGLLLTIAAPQGPAGATRIELVLANPDAIAVVDGQITGGDVRYYRQKSITAPVEDLAQLDGFVVRIEGRDGRGDERFVPFVLAYGDRPEPIAIGAVLDPSGLPMELQVPAGARVEATATMTPLAPADLAKGVLRGEIAELPCEENAGAWRSGLAWHPPAGSPLRLLLPDPDGDSKQDASSRPLDLDCDGYTADGRDCDDVRVRYNPGAAERCDGEDMNCDGSPYAVTACGPATTTCGTGPTDGVRLCEDVASPTPPGECVALPSCLCRAGPCAKCTLAFEADAMAKPCAPAAGKLSNLGACSPATPCTVEVLQEDGPWEATVAADEDGPFERRTMVTTGEAWLRVKARLSSLPAQGGASVGAVHLAIKVGPAEPRYVGIDLQLESAGRDDCATTLTPSGYHGMLCGL